MGASPGDGKGAGDDALFAAAAAGAAPLNAVWNQESWAAAFLDNARQFSVQLVCAGGSGAMAKTAVAPLERAKVRAARAPRRRGTSLLRCRGVAPHLLLAGELPAGRLPKHTSRSPAAWPPPEGSSWELCTTERRPHPLCTDIGPSAPHGLWAPRAAVPERVGRAVAHAHGGGRLAGARRAARRGAGVGL